MRTVVQVGGQEYVAEAFGYDEDGAPLDWAVYDDEGEDITETLGAGEKDKAFFQLFYTRKEALADRAFDREKRELYRRSE